MDSCKPVTDFGILEYPPRVLVNFVIITLTTTETVLISLNGSWLKSFIFLTKFCVFFFFCKLFLFLQSLYRKLYTKKKKKKRKRKKERMKGNYHIQDFSFGISLKFESFELYILIFWNLTFTFWNLKVFKFYILMF